MVIAQNMWLTAWKRNEIYWERNENCFLKNHCFWNNKKQKLQSQKILYNIIKLAKKTRALQLFC